ncbi:heme biosynthesis HemY N-terminal domain-containing protein [Porticoccus sp. W117]|uniref:heme biosynthesis HemY N-terminal domain-containing protein n=1 Tax=Porticoccus sp. W117 TaxID=3054777 RepID=UPI0025934AF9|nr:heme biosynthesis HemY N-terminal domain-containing protein [Porticoccus sp. W117]MDM3871739.1 heme biosynthesis HemY N-terminal domain-containing protein [Porticoccus sp. W117]
MRRLVLIFAAALLLGTGLSWLMSRESGYLLIAVGNTTIEMNLWAAVIALILLWLVARLLWRLLSTLKVFAGWRRARLSRRRAQTARGLLYFIEGRWQRARQQLVRGAHQSGMPLVNYLAAATAAYEEGNWEAAQTLLNKAQEIAEEDNPAVEIAKARLYLKEQRYEEALSILNRVHQEYPNHTNVLRLLEKAYRGLNDWHNLQQLLPQLRKDSGYDRQQFQQLEVEVYANQMASLAERWAKTDKASDKTKHQQAIDQLRQSMPSVVKRNAQLVAAYSDHLQARGDGQQAEKLLHSALNNHWDDSLIRRYGLLVGGDVSTQMVIAEAWLRERPNNPALLLALGRLAQKAELWGKARDYLESALGLSHAPEIYAELARLMAQLGEVDKSAAYYQRGLLESAAN